ncbi:protein arginine N-methyltransferase 9 isoform X1 [Leptinotarsa decemlineata]|uniref:protein arginine N-methyltransferase 9 isoform X1 n=1 Tax=Leptinotarsa decemlineata TaxID=7539 RepID=UPI003D308D5D
MAGRVPGICNPKKTTDNSFYYLEKAKQSCVNKQYSIAHENFVLYFESLEDPLESTLEVQTVFTTLVCKMGMVLEEICDFEELLKVYLQALNFFPDNHIILTNLGGYMFRVAEIDIARRYLERAVKVKSDYLPAEVNLMHAKWYQIPRWHFRMLNDKRRNLAYNQAITECINQGFKNVFDIGSGCGFLSLAAFRHEDTDVTAFEENKILFYMSKEIYMANGAHNIHGYQCNSTRLFDSQEKCNFIVTEVFDVAFFGEKALESIFHALTVLRTEEEYRIVPCRAKIYFRGISSNELMQKHQCISTNSINLLNLHDAIITEHNAEPYEAEHLSEYDVTYMTEPICIMDIDFYDIGQILHILNDTAFRPVYNVKAKRDGVLHAVTVWFDLHLTENISITTDPLSEDRVTCWEQAVIYLDRPVRVKAGQILPFVFAVVNSKLHVKFVYKKHDPRKHFLVTKEVITFLNDDALVDSIVQMAKKLQNANLIVVDVNIVPLLGFLLSKNNNSKIYYTLKNDTDAIFFDYIMTQNNLPKGRLSILDEEELIGSQRKCLFFFDVISPDGLLETSPYRLGKKQRTIKLPQGVRVSVQLIYSSYIDRCNRVLDENVLGFRIGEFMNEYSGYEHPSLEKFEHTVHSEPVEFPLGGNGEKTKKVKVTKGGLVNALYMWFDIQFYEDIIFSTKNSTHYKKTCFFFTSKAVEEDDILCIKMNLEGPYLKFSL